MQDRTQCSREIAARFPGIGFDLEEAKTSLVQAATAGSLAAALGSLQIALSRAAQARTKLLQEFNLLQGGEVEKPRPAPVHVRSLVEASNQCLLRTTVRFCNDPQAAAAAFIIHTDPRDLPGRGFRCGDCRHEEG